MRYVIGVLSVVSLGGGIFLEYRYAPLAWIMGKYRKVVG